MDAKKTGELVKEMILSDWNNLPEEKKKQLAEQMLRFKNYDRKTGMPIE